MKRSPLAFLLPLVALSATTFLAGCKKTETSYYYGGLLNASHADKKVLELYVPVDNKLVLRTACIDVNGDKIFDYTVNFADNGEISDIDMTGAAERLERSIAVEGFEQPTRPPTFGASPALLGVVEAAQTTPGQPTLAELYGNNPEVSQTRAWQLAVALRNAPTALLPEIIRKADYSLRNGNNSRVGQSAFILAGCGPAGVKQLAIVLGAAAKDRRDAQIKAETGRNTTTGEFTTEAKFFHARANTLERVSEKIAVALLSTKTSILPIFTELVYALKLNESGNVQHNIFKAIEAEARRNPLEMKRRLHELREIAPGKGVVFADAVENIYDIAQLLESYSLEVTKVPIQDPINERILETNRRVMEKSATLLDDGRSGAPRQSFTPATLPTSTTLFPTPPPPPPPPPPNAAPVRATYPTPFSAPPPPPPATGGASAPPAGTPNTGLPNALPPPVKDTPPPKPPTSAPLPGVR
ncbi:MAG: hypothetical protein LBT53_01985 [Puniceicoccales bacterium]|nr:hypothetical protein [Puniceicoccales bacterium]